MKLTLLKWHPYSNRQLDMRSSLSAYKSAADGYHTFYNINFNRNDEVSTVQTINYTPGEHDEEDTFKGDYLIVSSNDIPSNAISNDVVSRWYVLEDRWNRKHQRILTLRRDLVADAWDDIKDDDFYCMRGIVPYGNTFIYNSESVGFNKTLVSKTKMTDNEEKQYIVVYTSSNYNGGTYSTIPMIQYNTWDDVPSSLRDLIGVTNTHKAQDNFIYWYLSASDYQRSDGWCTDNKYRIWQISINTIDNSVTVTLKTSNSKVLDVNGDAINETKLCVRYDQGTPSAYIRIDFQRLLQTGIPSDIDAIRYEHCNTDPAAGYPEWGGQDINIIGGGSYVGGHHCNWSKVPSATAQGYYPVGDPDAYRLWTQSLINGSAATYHVFDTVPYSQSIYLLYRTVTDRMLLTTITVDSYSVSIPANYQSLRPYKAFYFEYDSSTMNLIYLLSRDIGTYIYDIQLVPYQPLSTKSNYTKGIELHWIEEFVATYQYLYTGWTIGGTNADQKYSSLTDMIRICSPDGTAMWDFNPAQANCSNASINFYIEQELEPFTVNYFIHTDLFGLYGSNPPNNLNGLSFSYICSFPYATSQWANYKANNSAYAQAFSRQIENLSKTQDVQRQSQIWSSLAGMASAAATGAAIGSVVPGLGTAAGAVIGAVASGLGGYGDYKTQEDMNEEAISYAKDQFAFNCQNMIAAPNTLSNGNGVLAPTNTIFPTIELYKATNEEKTAWKKYETYNAWSLNMISTLDQMKYYGTTYSSVSSYIKGSLCRCSLHEDAHFISELDYELQRGIYV